MTIVAIDHPGLGFDDLEALVERLRAGGVSVIPDEVPVAGGGSRYFTEDPFGSRIELLRAP